MNTVRKGSFPHVLFLGQRGCNKQQVEKVSPSSLMFLPTACLAAVFQIKRDRQVMPPQRFGCVIDRSIVAMTSRKHAQQKTPCYLVVLCSTVRACSSYSLPEICQEGLHSSSTEPMQCTRQLAGHLFATTISSSHNAISIPLESQTEIT